MHWNLDCGKQLVMIIGFLTTLKNLISNHNPNCACIHCTCTFFLCWSSVFLLFIYLSKNLVHMYSLTLQREIIQALLISFQETSLADCCLVLQLPEQNIGSKENHSLKLPFMVWKHGFNKAPDAIHFLCYMWYFSNRPKYYYYYYYWCLLLSSI